MELSVNGQLKHAARMAKTTSRTEKTPFAAGTGKKTAFQTSRTDKLALSQSALSFLQELNRQDMEKQRKLLEAKQQGNGDLDVLNKSLKTMDKCQKIAARIQKGDKVPPEDERYLMDNDPDGYKLAIAARMPKEKPKEWDSVLEDEDRESSGGETAQAADSGAEAPETAEPAEV